MENRTTIKECTNRRDYHTGRLLELDGNRPMSEKILNLEMLGCGSCKGFDLSCPDYTPRYGDYKTKLFQ